MTDEWLIWKDLEGLRVSLVKDHCPDVSHSDGSGFLLYPVCPYYKFFLERRLNLWHILISDVQQDVSIYVKYILYIIHLNLCDLIRCYTEAWRTVFQVSAGGVIKVLQSIFMEWLMRTMRYLRRASAPEHEYKHRASPLHRPAGQNASCSCQPHKHSRHRRMYHRL
jgi:hypothetical protein